MAGCTLTDSGALKLWWLCVVWYSCLGQEDNGFEQLLLYREDRGEQDGWLHID